MTDSRADDPPDPARVTVSDETQTLSGAATRRLRQLAAGALADLGVPGDMAVDILYVDPDAMTALNVEHMGGDGPTDVLAFPLDEPGERAGDVPMVLGDVVLCGEVAESQAREAGRDPWAEIEMLLVHGLLHLLGYDHQDEDERTEMFSLTDKLLAARGGHSR